MPRARLCFSVRFIFGVLFEERKEKESNPPQESWRSWCRLESGPAMGRTWESGHAVLLSFVFVILACCFSLLFLTGTREGEGYKLAVSRRFSFSSSAGGNLVIGVSVHLSLSLSLSLRILVSVLSIEGTDCRLHELGRLADRTGGKVMIANPNKLQTELQQVLESRIVATHCSVTLLLPTTLTVKGEREQGHKAIREVGNVTADKEITFRFRASEQDTQILLSGGCVFVQLQIRYRRMDGQTVLRVLSVDRRVTQDSSQVLFSLSLSILQLNASQSCAALAVRGRYKDAQSEGETQRKLMERTLNHMRSPEEKQQYTQWVENMAHIYDNIQNYKGSLTDTGAALLYGMKNGNRKSVSLKNGTKPKM